MMITLQSYIRLWRNTLRRWVTDPKVHTGLRAAAYVLAGFFLSAAALGQHPQPLTLGLVCSLGPWPSLLCALGGSAGYLLFWGTAGLQGVLWLALGALCRGFLAQRRITVSTPALMPAVAGLITAMSGLAFQTWLGDETAIPMYLLRLLLATGSAALFGVVVHRRSSAADWLACGMAVLALAQVSLFPGFSLGFPAAAVLACTASFPAAALGGLALDLAGIAAAPMTAVMCLAYLVRLLPWGKRWTVHIAPGVSYLLVMSLCGVWDLHPLPGLLLGGALALAVPGQPKVSRRRGELGVAQVRLEMVSGFFSQAQQILLEAQPAAVDEEALLLRATERVCGTCPCRKSCREKASAAALPITILHKPLLDSSDLPLSCKKEGRLLQELRRTQEQLRQIRAGREQQREYRCALIQQYQFLGEYLQDLADDLSRRMEQTLPRYRAEVAYCANRPREDNGDRCVHFAGVGCRYYVILCDGMGTGMGAIDEGNTALTLLRKLLSAGYPAHYALRSLNSICALRGKAGAVTVDLAELDLHTGRATLYKWGAAPSWLLSDAGVQKIGTAGPPPGLSVTEDRETAQRLSLRRGEILALLSDGVGGEEALRCYVATPEEPLGELAARLLESGGAESRDDATVATIRLSPAPAKT